MNVTEYYSCANVTDEECEAGNGTPTSTLDQVITQMSQNKYTGVTFDYEVEDSPIPSLSEWKGFNKLLQDKGLKTALTMANAGLGVGLKYGFDQGQENFIG